MGRQSACDVLSELPKWKIINGACNQAMADIKIRQTALPLGSIGILRKLFGRITTRLVTGPFVNGVPVSIGDQKRQAVRVVLLQPRLQGLEAGVSLRLQKSDVPEGESGNGLLMRSARVYRTRTENRLVDVDLSRELRAL